MLPSGSLPIAEYIGILASTSVKQRHSEGPSYDQGVRAGGWQRFFFGMRVAGRELRGPLHFRWFGIDYNTLDNFFLSICGSRVPISNGRTIKKFRGVNHAEQAGYHEREKPLSSSINLFMTYWFSSRQDVLTVFISVRLWAESWFF